MEESPLSAIADGIITGIRFGLANRQEICTSSNSDCPISHASQLSNPFLGLPLESGKCESCGTAEPGECEGHFGYIELPIPIYHPSHVSELKRMLSLLCLKCLKLKNRKIQVKNVGVAERVLSMCCEEASQISISEAKTADGACYLELKIPSRSHILNDFWNFLERYGFRYGDGNCRALLPSEVMVILRKIPEETRKKLAGKGFFPQDGYILQYLPVPPNCLSVPDISDGTSVMSSDHSIAVLKKVLKQIEIIKSSRSGTPNFESHEIEANDLQAAVAQYLQVRGTAKASRDVDGRFGIKREPNDSSTKVWLEKMRTLFIRKGSGFSSRSIITGDPYKGVGEIGLPFEIAQRITFEEKVSQHNMSYLQKLVDEKLCLTYRDGSSTYSLREGSKGHTFLRPGQVVHRRIMDGDIVFINRPPTTHKHSLQALSVYVHDDHTVKINPLICAPLSADFDGDAIHLFYPQSLPAKAEVWELFSVGKQLLSSHSGNLNLQLATDSLLSIKVMFKNYFFNRAAAQQLALYVSGVLPSPALLRARNSGPLWTVLQLLQTALPSNFDCCGERHNICESRILQLDFNRDIMSSVLNDIVTSIFFGKGPNEVLRFFDFLQPMLMEYLYSEGFSVGLEDFFVPNEVLDSIQTQIQNVSPLLYHLRSSYNELIELQLEKHIRHVKMPVANFILKSSAMGNLIDSKSDSAINKVVQQIGFLGMQLSDKGKFYSKTLVGDIASLFQKKYPLCENYPSEEFGVVRSCLFHGLDPYQSMVHSISSREVIVRSSRGLTEPGTLFKNLMAILRDVVICYDGTVRNVCSNSIIQFEYGTQTGTMAQTFFAAGEPVGVLAATAMSNPAYKAVLDSSPSSNSSWAMMKEILLCGVKFKNDQVDRRVILYLNDCDCGRKYCRENAAYLVKKQLKKVSLKDVAVEFLIEYNRQQQTAFESQSEIDAGLVGHVHLNEVLIKDSHIGMDEVFEKCQDTVRSFWKKKKVGHLFKRIELSVSQCCSFRQSCESKGRDMPCLKFFWKETSDNHLERTSHIFADTICPVLLETIIKGDPRVCSADIIWISPDTTTWIRNPSKSQKGELALDVVLEKKAMKQSGDAWRIVIDSCLPVIHLIDSSRSIPYSIKQVQELLGISCAFEQAIQRLSSSVTMVAKGVLKEHLILLANSMTCSGNLVGFNKAGIKALSRSLNVQVPFTEATLFTPKKCFETAAEKCHVDSLSSIVASCSWGKHVAVGTGSSFDILWDTREVELNQHNGTDVYDFLNLVRSSSGVERNSGCLGAEIDDLDMYYESDEVALSPEHASDKPVFEDSAEFGIADESDWNKGSQSLPERTGGLISSTADVWRKNVEEDSANGWAKKVEKSHNIEESGAWSSWAKTGEESDQTQWNKKDSEPLPDQAVPLISSTVGGWGKRLEEDAGDGWSKVERSGDKAQQSGWGKKADEADWNKKDMQPLPDQAGLLNSSTDVVWGEKSEDDSANGWGKKAEKAVDTRWNKKDSQSLSDQDYPSSTANWSKRSVEDSEDAWGKKVKNSGNDSQQSGPWLPKKVDGAAETPWNKNNSRPSTAGILGERLEEDSGDGWAKKVERSGWAKKVERSEWAKKVDDPVEEQWNKTESQDLPNQAGSGDGWAKKVERSGWAKKVERSGWAKKVDDPVEEQWNKKESQDLPNQAGAAISSSPGGWGDRSENDSAGGWAKKVETSAWAKKVDEPVESQWNEKESQHLPDQAGAAISSSTGAWGESSENDSTGGWGKKVDSIQQSDSWSSWAKKADEAGETKWSKKESQPPDSAAGLGSSTGWAKKEGWGSSNAGDGRYKRNRSFKPVGGANDESGVSATLTATGKRLDVFTAEEQDLLLEIEPVMQSIRRVMHQSGYNDGDPLSADDQSYIVDHVFNYHPDKVVKMGSGIDYVMVNKHSNFQDTRCLYIVSTDGRKEDFSYRKCLENFIKGKYPDRAEAFMAKYFKRHNQPRPGWNRERSAAPEEAATENKPRGWE